jgi:hypothetical protein
MPNPKNEQLSLSEYKTRQAKQGKRKKLLDLPLPVKFIFVIPLVFFIILVLGYVIYIRQIAATGSAHP